MDPDELLNRLFDGTTVEDLRDRAIEQTSKYAEKWTGDTSNDKLALAMIASMRPMLEAITEASRKGDANDMIYKLAILHFTTCIKNVHTLDDIAKLRDL